MLWKENLWLRAFGVLSAPLMGFCSPRILRLDDEGSVVRLPLNLRTRRRDIGAMYLGALAIGADVAAGIIPFRWADSLGGRFSIVFKDIHSEFHKRAESAVHFTCRDGLAVKALLEKARETGERQFMEMRVMATAPKSLGEEPVASFRLTLSVKDKAHDRS